MHRTVGVVAVVALALASCRKPGGDSAEVMTRFKGFVSDMCACKDKACADKVQEGMTEWSTEMARKGGSRSDRPDEASMKELTTLGEHYGECMVKAMGDTTAPVTPPAPDTPPEQPDPIKLSRPADRPSLATLVQEAKDYYRTAEEHLALHVLTARYVASDGTLDPTYGEVVIGLGNPLPTAKAPAPITDDPNRPTGAPIPQPEEAPPEDTWTMRPDDALCPSATWSAMSGWTWKDKDRLCTTAAELIPRCSTAEVWKRAKAKRAPANAIAVLDLVRLDNGTQSWSFSITDELRRVDIDLELKDNCAAVVEKP